MCRSIIVTRCGAVYTAVISSLLPATGWSVDKHGGYLIYTSRSKAYGIRRGARAHRLTYELLAGLDPGTLPSDIQIHHQDYNKLNNCPGNLVAMPGCMNPSPAHRTQCPYTGRWISLDTLAEITGNKKSSVL